MLDIPFRSNKNARSPPEDDDVNSKVRKINTSPTDTGLATWGDDIARPISSLDGDDKDMDTEEGEYKEDDEQEQDEEDREEDLQVENILQALENIRKSTSREVTGKVAFTRGDQKRVGDATNIIFTNMIRIIRRLHRNEKENLKLKMNVKEQTAKVQFLERQLVGQQVTITEERSRAPQRVSYADTVKSFGTIPARVDSQKEEVPWTTPPKPTKSLDSQFYIECTDGEDISQKWTEIRRKINPKDIDGGLRATIKIGKKKMLLKAQSIEQKDKLMNIIKSNPDIDCKEDDHRNPVLQICGCPAGLTEAEILETIIIENEELTAIACEDELRRGLKLLAKKTCRIETKENLIISASPHIARCILKRGKLNMNLTSLFVIEKIDVALCFKCLAFGHIMKNCDSKDDLCHRCGGKHNSTTCENKLNCINCQKMRIKEREHSARDSQCPCYKRKLQLQREKTNYGQ